MKKTDLEKSKALKLMGKLKQSPPPDRFAVASANPALDRREQRKQDQAAGLVSFPIKLTQATIDRLRALSVEREQNINQVVAELLEKALAG